MQPLLPDDDRRAEQVRQLTDLSRALTYALDPEQIFRVATARAAAIFRAERVLLLLGDEEGLLRVHAAHGVPEAELGDVALPLTESLGAALQRLLGCSTRESFLGVPLVASGAVTGVLALVRPGTPADEDEWLLSAVADQVAVALENARLARELREARAERARAVRGADAADEAKDRALATLSHDLRSPLNAIDSFAELMEMEILGEVTDRQREALGRIRMSGRHLLAVLENVLEMARLNAGVVRVRMTDVPLSQVVEETLLMVRHNAAARDQELRLEGGAETVVSADPDRLRQILINIVGNAIKYTPPGGVIRIVPTCRTGEEATWGCVSVIDNGPGIPAERQADVFQPYYRVPGTGGETTEGAGLGLAISRELARQMGGDVELESAPGGGCTFTVRLPLAAAQPQS